jgi:recombination protein RecA
VKVVKNKMAPPFKEALFDMIYPTGIDKVSSMIDAALNCGVLQKSGAWFRYGEKQIAQGRDGTKEAVKADPKLKAAIYTDVKKKIGLK